MSKGFVVCLPDGTEREIEGYGANRALAMFMRSEGKDLIPIGTEFKMKAHKGRVRTYKRIDQSISLYEIGADSRGPDRYKARRKKKDTLSRRY